MVGDGSNVGKILRDKIDRECRLLPHNGRPPSWVRASAFRRSFEAAEELGARYWKLHTANSLVRLLRKAGETDEVRTLLTPISDWFPEGFDTPEMKDAKALLDELAQACR